MEWINLHTSVLDSVEFVGSEPVEQATWLKLMRFSFGQENGGRISGCGKWKDRKWQQLTRCTKREASEECDLWEWDGDDLVLAFYPLEKEEEVKRMRALGNQTTDAKKNAAKANGAKGGRPKKEPNGNPTDELEETQRKTQRVGFKEPNEKTHGKPTENPYKGKEGNGREWNGKECESASARSDHKKPKPEKPEAAQQIVAAYPRREKLADALRIVDAQLSDGEDADAMLAGTQAAAKVIASLPGKHLNRYVPSATAFFRDKRWADDPETLKRQGNKETGQASLDLEEAKRQLGGRAAYIEINRK